MWTAAPEAGARRWRCSGCGCIKAGLESRLCGRRSRAAAGRLTADERRAVEAVLAEIGAADAQ
jgi:hypothetical protein